MRAVGLSRVTPVEDFLDSDIDAEALEQNIDEIGKSWSTSLKALPLCLVSQKSGILQARKTQASSLDLERV